MRGMFGSGRMSSAFCYEGVFVMQIWQDLWQPATGWQGGAIPQSDTQLVLAFGARELLDEPGMLDTVTQRFPGAVSVLCSTAGEIFGTQVLDGSLSVAAVRFDHTRIKAVHAHLSDHGGSTGTGAHLGKQLAAEDLAHVLVLSDGLAINGSELAAGITAWVPETTTVTGGLSGDGSRFERTLVGLNAQPTTETVVAIGFYGDRLRVGHGSLGGWDPFGPDRLVTRAAGNVLYELDGQSALELYRAYLGPYANDLPASGLLFPLLVHAQNDSSGLVRTVLAVNDDDQSMTFAGEIHEGFYARLMKANFDRLIDGATGAAQTCRALTAGTTPQLAILISCVGRKLVLQQRIEEEVESVREVLGDEAVLTGFYSYGELSPMLDSARCELHNQTMTITTFCEI